MAWYYMQHVKTAAENIFHFELRIGTTYLAMRGVYGEYFAENFTHYNATGL